MLHYYCVHGALDLSGFGDLYSSFWRGLVLRLSHDQPVVRQAVIALSHAHLDFASKDYVAGNSSVPTEALDHYSRAVGRLRRYLAGEQHPSPKVALTCSVLFYCFENAVGHFEAAMAHLRNGLAIQARAKRCPPAKGDDADDMHTLTAMVGRLDLQASVFAENRHPVVETTSPEERAGLAPCVPLGFRNLLEAQTCLEKLHVWLFRFLNIQMEFKYVPANELPLHVIHEKHELVKQFRQWSATLDEYMAHYSDDHSHRDVGVEEGSLMLRIHQGVTQMLLLGNFPMREQQLFGAVPNPTASGILNMAETLVQRRLRNSTAEARAQPKLPRSFSSGIGILIPVFTLAVKCRDVDICERALAILAHSNRREGLTDARTIYKATQRIAQVRSQGTISDDIARAAFVKGYGLDQESSADYPLELWGAEAFDTQPGLYTAAKMLADSSDQWDESLWDSLGTSMGQESGSSDSSSWSSGTSPGLP